MSETETILVKYTGNADPSASTGAVTFQDDRPPLVLGGPEGEITTAEFSLLSSRGVVLERISDGYDDLTRDELKTRLDELDPAVEYKGNAKQEDLVALLRENVRNREVPPPGAVETTSLGPAEGSAAGPGGPPPPGPAGAVPPVTPGGGVA